MKTPAVNAVNPQPGDKVLFKWRGIWAPGRVMNEGTRLRLPIQRAEFAPTAAMGRRIYWRNRTQLFQP